MSSGGRSETGIRGRPGMFEESGALWLYNFACLLALNFPAAKKGETPSPTLGAD
jgi:hypothetical protein